MNLSPRITRRVVAAVAVALVLTGCGGGNGADGSADPPVSGASTDVEGAELAGLHFDVRRDPG